MKVVKKPGRNEHMAWIHICGQSSKEEFRKLGLIALTGTVEEFKEEADKWTKGQPYNAELLQEMAVAHMQGRDW